MPPIQIAQTKKPEPKTTQFKTLDDIPFNESVTVLCYGKTGSGKTTYCGTAGDRTLYINIGKSIDTLRAPFFVTKYGRVSPALILEPKEVMDDWGIPQHALAFDEICEGISDALALRSSEFDTIVIDDITNLRRFAMFKGLEVNNSLQKSKALESSRKFDVVIPGVQDYGMEMSLVYQFIAQTIDLCKRHKKHLIMPAHERLTMQRPRGADGKPIIGAPMEIINTRPSFTGEKAPDEIAALFDWVLHMEAVGGGINTVFRAKTQGSEELIARVYGGIFSVTETDPNFLKMVHKSNEMMRKAIQK